MRFIWLTFFVLAAAIIGFFSRSSKVKLPVAPPAPVAAVVQRTAPAATPTVEPAPISSVADELPPAAAARADSVVRFALRQLGTNYCYAGTTPATGFDCSGFVLYVFDHFGVPVPHSTALLIDVGQPVARAAARPGDIVVFTGTAPTSTTPGHAGIVVSAPGEQPLRFVHSSSARREPGVKISQVEGTDYERRFMQVRRVLSGKGLAMSKDSAFTPNLSTPSSPKPTLHAKTTTPAARPAARRAPAPQRKPGRSRRHHARRRL